MVEQILVTLLLISIIGPLVWISLFTIGFFIVDMAGYRHFCYACERHYWGRGGNICSACGESRRDVSA